MARFDSNYKMSPPLRTEADKGTLRPGADADVTIIDPDVEWVIDPTQFRSKSRNCPFAGWTVTGRAHMVLVGGVVKHAIRGESSVRQVRTGNRALERAATEL